METKDKVAGAIVRRGRDGGGGIQYWRSDSKIIYYVESRNRPSVASFASLILRRVVLHESPSRTSSHQIFTLCQPPALHRDLISSNHHRFIPQPATTTFLAAFYPPNPRAPTAPPHPRRRPFCRATHTLPTPLHIALRIATAKRTRQHPPQRPTTSARSD